MVKHIHEYVCEICSVVYDKEESAKACEDWGLPAPIPVKIGDEVKLKNRSMGTYTVTTVKGFKFGNRFDGFSICPTMLKENPHEWLALVSPAVYLDHKWEGDLSVISLELYMLKETHGYVRSDNDASGVPRASEGAPTKNPGS